MIAMLLSLSCAQVDVALRNVETAGAAAKGKQEAGLQAIEKAIRLAQPKCNCPTCVVPPGLAKPSPSPVSPPAPKAEVLDPPLWVWIVIISVAATATGAATTGIVMSVIK